MAVLPWSPDVTEKSMKLKEVRRCQDQAFKYP